MIEVLIEKRLKEVFPDAYDRKKKWVKKIRRTGDEPLTMMTLAEELDSVRLIPLELKTNDKEEEQKVIYISTKIENNVKKLLNALGVKNAMNPERLSFRRNKDLADKKQLVLEPRTEKLI